MHRGGGGVARWATIAVVATLGVAGCSGDEEEPGATSSTSDSASASAEPSASSSDPTEVPPAETPPAMPPEAQVADVNGAAAFIRHYFALANYAYRTGDVGAVDEVAADDCSACSDMSSEIAASYEAGGFIRGGLATVTDVVVTPGDLSTYAESLTVLSIEKGEYVDSNGQLTNSTTAIAELGVTVLLQRSEETWQMWEWGKDDGVD